MARQYYEDDHDSDGGGFGLIGMLVVGGFLLFLFLSIIPIILGGLAALLGGGLFGGNNGAGIAIPLTTLNANQGIVGRRRRSAGTGIPSSFNFKNIISTLESAYKKYSSQ